MNHEDKISGLNQYGSLGLCTLLSSYNVNKVIYIWKAETLRDPCETFEINDCELDRQTPLVKFKAQGNFFQVLENNLLYVVLFTSVLS